MKLVGVSQWVRTLCKSHLTNAYPAGQERTRAPPCKGPYEAGGRAKAGRATELLRVCGACGHAWGCKSPVQVCV